MDEYLAWLLEPTPWHWLTLAAILAAFELTSMSFFLLFPAAAAGATALAVWLEPELDWRLQVLAFAALSVAATAIGRALLRKYRGGDGPLLVNARGRLYSGRRLRLGEALENGRGRVRLDDTWWTAESETGETIAAAALVEIVRVDGATVKVRPVDG